MTTPTSMDEHVTSSEELKQQAWEWLRLLTSGKADVDDARRFRQWVRSSPAHQASYDEIKFRWDAFKLPVDAFLRANPDAVEFHERVRRGVVPSRRLFLGAAVGAAGVAGIAGIAIAYPPLGLWSAPATWGADYRTATGEQRTLALADRVDVTLNTRTSIRRQMSGGQTVGLDLLAGETAVDLNGSGRPFAVIAGAGRSLAASGQFEVRYLDGKVCVTCIAGAVRIEHHAGGRTLEARQQAIYDGDSISGVASIDPASVAAWRKGMLVFNQTPLADVLVEINRYRSGHVTLLNTAMRGKTVTGRYAIASLDMAIWQIQQVFGLHSQSLPAGVLILS